MSICLASTKGILAASAAQNNGATVENWEGKIKRLPLVRTLLERRYERWFATEGYGLLRGVFRTFDEASKSVPKTRLLGFNNQAYTTEFEQRMVRVFSFDYPVLYWLQRILGPGTTLFDFGGHRGLQYYGYSGYLTYPADLKWIVCDLPVIVEAGRKLAEERGAAQLHFTTSFDEAASADVLLAAGSLQYVDSPTFLEMLTALPTKPKHLVCNKVPLCAAESFVTLQNGGPAFMPLHVINRAEFVHSVEALGYELVDTWDVPTHSGEIPFHPAESFRWHTGLYFRLPG